jgi:hypothetical protein
MMHSLQRRIHTAVNISSEYAKRGHEDIINKTGTLRPVGITGRGKVKARYVAHGEGEQGGQCEGAEKIWPLQWNRSLQRRLQLM